MTRPLQSSPVLCLLTAMWVAMPFAMPVRLPPIPSFWAEVWSACGAVALLLLSAMRSSRLGGSAFRLPYLVVPFIGLALLSVLQLRFAPSEFPSARLPLLGMLLLGGAMVVLGAGLSLRGVAVQSLHGIAWGLVVALVPNLLAIYAETQGAWIQFDGLYPMEFSGRAFGFVGQPNNLATYAVMAWGACVGLRFDDRMGRLPYLIFSAAAALLVVASGSRSGLLGWVLVAMAGVLTARFDAIPVRRKRKTAVVLLGAVLLVVAWLGWWLWLDPTGSAPGVRTDAQGRLEAARDAFQLWLHHPLWGVGYSNFVGARVTELHGAMSEPALGHAHNLFLHLLAVWGGVGALLGLVAVVFLVRRTWQALRTTEDGGGSTFVAIAFVVAVLNHSQFEYPLWYAFFLLPFCFCAGVLCPDGWSVKTRTASSAFAMAGWLIVLGGVGLASADYLRLQRVYWGVEQRRAQDPQQRLIVPRAEIDQVARATMFPVVADFMYVRTLDTDGFMMAEKQRIAERVMLSYMGPETLARYAAFSVAAGDEASATRWLRRMHDRSEPLYRDALSVMHVYAKRQPALAAYLETISASK